MKICTLVPSRKTSGTRVEDLRQETEFNVCMKSERALASLDAWHISASSFVCKC